MGYNYTNNNVCNNMMVSITPKKNENQKYEFNTVQPPDQFNCWVLGTPQQLHMGSLTFWLPMKFQGSSFFREKGPRFGSYREISAWRKWTSALTGWWLSTLEKMSVSLVELDWIMLQILGGIRMDLQHPIMSMAKEIIGNIQLKKWNWIYIPA
jgi:hypothetical protein